MSERTMILDRLEEIDSRYAYYHVDGEERGALVVESETGDTLLPPYRGRWTALEDVEDREDALDAARAWEEAAGNTRLYDVVYYAPGGSAKSLSVGPHCEDDEEVVLRGASLDEARTAVERRLAGRMDPDDARWEGVPEMNAVEAYHESSEELCGGYYIRPSDA